MLRSADYQKPKTVGTSQQPRPKVPAAADACHGKMPAVERGRNGKRSPPHHRRHSHSPPKPPCPTAKTFPCGVSVTGGTTTDTLHVTGVTNLDGDVVAGGDIDAAGDITSNGGLCIPNAICATFDISNPTYTVPTDIFTLRTLFNIKRTPKTSTSLPLAFSDAPLAPNPLLNGTPIPLAGGLLTLTSQTKGPWYFLDLPNDPTKKASVDVAGTRVLECGIPEAFKPNPGGPGGPNLPVNNENSVAELVNTSSNVLDFTLMMRSSTEPSYDFAYVYKNGLRILTASGAGSSATEPYVISSVQVKLLPGDVLRLQFVKDPAYYAGLDNVYFYVKDLVASIPTSIPTRLFVKRGTSTVLDYSFVINFDVVTSYLLIRSFQFRAGDVIKLEFDTVSYTNIVVDYTSLL